MMSELEKLEAYLNERGIPHERIEEGRTLGERFYAWSQIVVYDERGERQWDVVCHYGSYGYEEGLLEAMGAPIVRASDGDSVVGWLTAQDVIDRLEGRV